MTDGEKVVNRPPKKSRLECLILFICHDPTGSILFDMKLFIIAIICIICFCLFPPLALAPRPQAGGSAHQ